MSRRILSLVLVLATLMAMMSYVFAAEETKLPEDAQVYFLTDPIFENKGIVDISCVDDYYVVIPQSGYHLVVDPFGNQIFPMGSYDVQFYYGKILAVTNGSKVAIYNGKRQMSEFIYVKTEKTGELIRAERADGTYDFYSASDGKKISAPKAPAGWTLYDLLGNDAMLLRRNYHPEAFLPYEYQICDWNGTVLRSNIVGTASKETENIVSFSNPGYGTEFVGSDGKVLAGGSVRLELTPSKGRYFITKTIVIPPSDPELDAKTYSFCYLYDTELNLLTTYNDIRFKRATIISDDLVFFTLEDGSSVLMNEKGETLKSWQNAMCTIAESTMWTIGKDDRWGFAIETPDECTLYDMQMNTILTTDNAKSFDVTNDLLIVYSKDGKQLIYSKDGTLLFSREEGNYVKCKDGVLYEQTEAGYVFVSLSGETVGENVYEQIDENGTCSIGLLSACRDGKWYLVNAAAKEQNEQGFDGAVSFMPPSGGESASITTYCIGNKYGILSYYPMEKPIQPSFTDVFEWDWYFEAVEYCVANKLFSGTAPGIFEPNNTMTRAMLVTVLWRLEGEPTAQTQTTFADVKNGAWYADAVSWAAENGIVNGVSKESFNPDGNVTREQIATIMLRYSRHKGYDTEARTDISSFADAKQVSDYATDAMSWANAAGLISGSDENGKLLLLPQGNATRAQVAMILMRFVKTLEK